MPDVLLVKTIFRCRDGDVGLLTPTAAHWFDILRERVPQLKHHVISMSPPAAPSIITADERALLRGRCMQIRSLKVFPIEAIVRGYITGSAWSEYVNPMLQTGDAQECSLTKHPDIPRLAPSMVSPCLKVFSSAKSSPAAPSIR